MPDLQQDFWRGLQFVVDNMPADFMVERVDDLVVPVPSKLNKVKQI